MAIADIRHGIAVNLGTIRGLRSSETIPDQVNPPVAVIGLTSVTYDQSYGRAAVGLVDYRFVVTVVCGRASEREAQKRLDAYISTGASSVKAAIESDRTLGGYASDCRVTEMSNVSSAIINDVTYLTCDFAVQVYAN